MMDVQDEFANMLSGTNPAYARGLTEEDYAKLGAPIPASLIKSYEGRGGKQMRYVEVEVVEDCIREVDPNFSRLVADGPHGITVHYTIKGVTRGDTFDATDEAKYGTPATTAFAHACRRAGKAFGIGKELWQDEGQSATSRQSTSTASSNRQQSTERSKPASNRGNTNVPSNRGGGSGKGEFKPMPPSVSQVTWLNERLGVPMAIVDQLLANDGPEGNETRGSSASRLMNALFQRRNADQKGYDKNPTPAIESALAEVHLDNLIDALYDGDVDED